MKRETFRSMMVAAHCALALMLFSSPALAVLPPVGSGSVLLHLNADAANVTLAAGNTVTQWNDLSGLGNNFFQSTAARRPVWVSNGVGGLPAVRFTSDWLDTSGLLAADRAPFTFFAVTSGTTDPFALFDSAPAAQNTFRFGAFGAPFATPNFAVEFWDKSPALPLSVNPAGSVVSVTGYRNGTNNRVMELHEASADGTVTNSAVGNTAPIVFGGSGGPNIGTINNGGNGFYAGDLSELIIYNGQLTEPDRLAVENHLRAQYGLLPPPPPPSAIPSALGNYGQTVLAASPVTYWRLETNDLPPTDTANAPGPLQFGPQNGSYRDFNLYNLAQPGPRPTDLVNGAPLLGFAADNKAADFQGNGGGGNDVALFPDDGNLNFSTGLAFSLEAWVKADPNQEQGGAIIAKGDGGGGEQFAIDMVNNQFRFFLWNGGAPNMATVVQSTVPVNGTWQHVVGVFDQAEGVMKLYVNGLEVGSQTPPTSIVNNTHDVSVGARQNQGTTAYNLNFDGLIDEVAVYAYPLSAAQVGDHFRAAFVPEPASTTLAALGMLVACGWGVRRRRAAAALRD